MSLDKLGSFLSGICIVHCVLFPLLMVFFPFLTVAFNASESYEWAFIGFSVIIAFFAMVQGYVYHRKPIPYMLAILGFGVFIFAKIALDKAFHFSLFTTTLVYVGAGASILFAHYLNHKFIHHAKCKCDQGHESFEDEMIKEMVDEYGKSQGWVKKDEKRP